MVSYSHLSLLTDVCILEGCLTRIVIYFYYYALLLCFYLSGRLTTSAFAGYDEFYVFEHFTGRKTRRIVFTWISPLLVTHDYLHKDYILYDHNTLNIN